MNCYVILFDENEIVSWFTMKKLTNNGMGWDSKRLLVHKTCADDWRCWGASNNGCHFPWMSIQVSDQTLAYFRQMGKYVVILVIRIGALSTYAPHSVDRMKNETRCDVVSYPYLHIPNGFYPRVTYYVWCLIIHHLHYLWLPITPPPTI